MPDGDVCSGLSRAEHTAPTKRLRSATVLYSHFQPPPPTQTYAPMSSYPTGGSGLYYGTDPQPQQGAYHDPPPPQFDPYNTQFAPHDPYDPEPEYREPYTDEPSYSLPQGQSMEPLEPSTKEKEDVSYYADESNAIPPKPRYVSSVAPVRSRLSYMSG